MFSAKSHANDKTGAKQFPSKITRRDAATTEQRAHPANVIQRASLNPRSLTREDILQLQRALGNQAVEGILSGYSSRESDASGAQAVESVGQRPGVIARTDENEKASPAVEPSAEEPSGEEGQEKISSESLTWSTGEAGGEDSRHEDRFDGEDASAGELKVKAKINLSQTPYEAWRTERQRGGAGRTDMPISSGVGFNVVGTKGQQLLGLNSFGSTRPQHTTDMNDLKQVEDKAELAAAHNLSLDITVQATNDDEVSGADSAVVYAGTWEDVYKDLYPNSYGKPRRTRYWNLEIVKSHEKVHYDDSVRATNLGVEAAIAWLNTQTLPSGKWPKKRRRAQALVAEANRKITEADLDDYFGSKSRNTPHDDCSGERRAYAAGKNQYMKIVNGIRARAKKQKWSGKVTAQDVRAWHRIVGHRE